MKKFLISLLLVTSTAYGQVPKISGTLAIDLSGGKITADFIITNIPTLDDPAFAMNRGLNIYDLKVNGQSVDYNIDFSFPVKSAFLSEGIGITPIIDTITSDTKVSIKYTGAFPTYLSTDEVASGDAMGIIAFKNNVLRASHQSLWYPALVDKTTNLTLTKYTYDIKVECKECESVYLGGSLPTTSKTAFLTTNQPNDLMLYAGKYKFSKSGNTYFLNTSLNKSQQKAVDISMDSIRNYYAGIFKIKAEEPIVLAQIFSIGKKSQYEKWGFSVFPCILADLSELHSQIDLQKCQFSDLIGLKLYSHELAHQYFGLKLKSDNEYWGFYSESFAEYMCLKVLEKQFGKQRYDAFLKQRYLNEKAVAKTYIHLDAVKFDIDNTHKYVYYPMVLLGLEQTIGKHRMFDFLNYIVTQTTSTTLNYQTFKQSAIRFGITESEWAAFEKRYIKSDNCLKEVLENLE